MLLHTLTSPYLQLWYDHVMILWWLSEFIKNVWWFLDDFIIVLWWLDQHEHSCSCSPSSPPTLIWWYHDGFMMIVKWSYNDFMMIFNDFIMIYDELIKTSTHAPACPSSPPAMIWWSYDVSPNLGTYDDIMIKIVRILWGFLIGLMIFLQYIIFHQDEHSCACSPLLTSCSISSPPLAGGKSPSSSSSSYSSSSLSSSSSSF